MNGEIIRGLILNVALLLSVSVIYNTFLTKARGKNLGHEVLLGIVVGFVGILVMLNTVKLNTGIIFDTRSILISASGLFFGLLPTSIAATMIAGYRIFIGGPGAVTGVIVTLSTAAVGLLWRRFRKRSVVNFKKKTLFEFYLFGLATHIMMLAGMLSIPKDVIAETFRQIVLPILLIYPVGSLLLCTVMAVGIKNMKTKQELEVSELRFRTVFEQAPIGIVITDNHRMLYTNSVFENILGMSKTQLKEVDWADLTHPDDLQADIDKFDLLRAGLIDDYSLVKRFIRADGSVVWVDMIIASMRNGNLLEDCHLCMVQDISERKEWEDKIVYLNYHDVLTGLYNRTFFDEELLKADKPEMMPVSLIIGDIDGLKIINDAFGHVQGDKLLIETAKIFKNCCRPGDIIARTGGDEFCILLPKTTMETAQNIFENMKEIFATHAGKMGEEGYFTSISLGYSTRNSTEELFEDVYKEAEENMYRRKLFKHRSLHSSLLTSIKTTMLEKSYETEEHAERLTELSISLGRELGLNEKDLTALELLSTLHDLGKISVDKNILTKPGPLDAEEWVEIRKHPLVGYRIAQAVPELRHISEYILSHHERWDGKGYPQGLAGEDIPLLARIITVADAHDSMTQDRAYRKAMMESAAIDELLNGSGSQFDADIVKVFIEKVLGAGRLAGTAAQAGDEPATTV